MSHLLHNSIRIHPNIYGGEGKVCLSILGTFSGPSWSPMYNILTILIQIQSLMDDKPWKHEPGRERIEKCDQYINYINYCSLVFVHDLLNRQTEFPEEIFTRMKEHFFNHRESFINRLQKFKDQKVIKNGFIFMDINCEYEKLIKFFHEFK
jgi:hypothetical protein